MKLLGGILILIGAMGGYLLYRSDAVRTLRLLSALEKDLALMRLLVCVHRRSLPDILTSELSGGLGGRYLWLPLSELIRGSRGTTAQCWEIAVSSLPDLIGRQIMPLGKFLTVGGDSLDQVVGEIRGELAASAAVLQEKQSRDLRLSAALCFCTSILFILVFA